MSVNIQPLADYVVVQPEEAETKTASGLLITQSAQEKPDTAKVVAVGKEVKGVKVGDRVLYVEQYGSSKTVKMGKDEYVLLKEENILATVK